MSSMNLQHIFTVLPPNPLRIIASNDNFPTVNPANLSKLPKWVSLKHTYSSSSSEKTTQTQQGKVENLHLVSLSRQGKLREARQFLEQMEEAGVPITPRSYQSLLETCGRLKSLSDGKHIHDRLKGTDSIGFLENCVIQMYCDCGSLIDAHQVFDEMSERDLVSWSMIISVYARSGLFGKSFSLFSKMLGTEIKLNSSVYTGLLKYLVKPSCLKIGRQLHSLIIRSGLSSSVSINAAICNMYVKCNCLDDAKLVFYQTAEKDSISFTALMVGYTKVEKHKEALALFENMVAQGVQLDEYVFSIVLKACAGLEDLNSGKQIHCYIAKLGFESDVSVGTPLVDFYVKCDCFGSADLAFGRISEPNDITWSALICGYCQMGKFEEAFKIYKSLRSQCSVSNSFIYTNIFQACSALAEVNLGAQAHADAIKGGLISYLYGESALVTMYSKCGRLDYATCAFESIDAPDTVAWTAIISGNANHGNASEALWLFEKMQKNGVRPNAVTFIAVLSACSHSGLVTEAKHYVDLMNSKYGVEPTIDHYDCMIDIYSRAGLLQEAFELIKSMPYDPDKMSWKCLLGGCWTHKNLELGKIAAENLLQLDPEDTAGYVMLFNLYASSGRWEEAAGIRKSMNEKNLQKELSCSWITVKGEVHRFVVGDKHHPRAEEIYSKLDELNYSAANDVNDAVLIEEDISAILQEQKDRSLYHSERLAIAFGLLSSPNNSSIVIFKNLRACKDCHEFAKHVSMVTGRKIVIRDALRFHHFQSGQCSCNDYW